MPAALGRLISIRMGYTSLLISLPEASSTALSMKLYVLGVFEAVAEDFAASVVSL